MDRYLGRLKEGKVKSLQELVDWNSAHEEEALTKGIPTRPESPPSTAKDIYTEYPNQELLERGLSFSDSDLREKVSAHAEAVAAKFDEIMTAYELDVIIAPGDCMLSEYAAAGGQ